MTDPTEHEHRDPVAMVRATSTPPAPDSFWDDLETALGNVSPTSERAAASPPGRDPMFGGRRSLVMAIAASVAALVVAVTWIVGQQRVSTVDPAVTTTTTVDEPVVDQVEEGSGDEETGDELRVDGDESPISTEATASTASTAPSEAASNDESQSTSSTTDPTGQQGLVVPHSVVVFDGDSPVGRLTDGDTIDFATIDQWLRIRVQDPGVGGAHFELTGTQTISRTDVSQPFTLTSGAWLPADGSYTLTVTPLDSEGRSGQSNTISFTVVDGPGSALATNHSQAVAQRVYLVNHDGFANIVELNDGDEITVDPDDAINIRVFGPGTHGARFELTGAMSMNTADTTRPFLLGGFDPWPPAEGAYQLVITPLNEDGEPGLVRTLRFTVAFTSG